VEKGGREGEQEVATTGRGVGAGGGGSKGWAWTGENHGLGGTGLWLVECGGGLGGQGEGLVGVWGGGEAGRGSKLAVGSGDWQGWKAVLAEVAKTGKDWDGQLVAGRTWMTGQQRQCNFRMWGKIQMMGEEELQ